MTTLYFAVLFPRLAPALRAMTVPSLGPGFYYAVLRPSLTLLRLAWLRCGPARNPPVLKGTLRLLASRALPCFAHDALKRPGHQPMLRPPSTAIIWPVTYSASRTR